MIDLYSSRKLLIHCRRFSSVCLLICVAAAVGFAGCEEPPQPAAPIADEKTGTDSPRSQPVDDSPEPYSHPDKLRQKLLRLAVEKSTEPSLRAAATEDADEFQAGGATKREPLIEAMATLLVNAHFRKHREAVREALIRVDPGGDRTAAVLSDRFDQAAIENRRAKERGFSPYDRRIDPAHGLAWLRRRPGDVIPLLVKHLDGRGFLQMEPSIVSLAQYGPRASEAVPELTKLLGHEDEDVWKLSAWALGRIGPAAKPAVPKLLKVAGKFDYAFDAEAAIPVDTLRTLGARGKAVQAKMLELVQQGAGEEANPHITLAAAELLSETDVSPKKAIPALVAAASRIWLDSRLDPEQNLPKAIIAFDPAGDLYLPSLLAPLQNEDPITEEEAGKLLVQISALKHAAEPAIKPLTEVALNHPNFDVRQLATWRLGNIGPAAIPALKRLYREGDPEDALGGLSNMEKAGRAAKDFVVGVIRDPDVDKRTRLQAIRTLAAIDGRSKEGVAVLTSLLGSEDEDLREAAVDALGEYGPAAAPAVDALRQRLATDSPLIRQAAGFTLGYIGAAAAPASDELTDALSHESRFVRHAAAEALESVPWSGEESWKQVMAYREKRRKADDYHPLEALDFMDTYAGDAERVLPLITQHLDADDPDMRTRAIRTLGGLHEPPVDLLARLLTESKRGATIEDTVEVLATMDPPPPRRILPQIFAAVEDAGSERSARIAQILVAIASSRESQQSSTADPAKQQTGEVSDGGESP